ncbi:hypothetical protein RvY_18821 [Ramazzottius varieornatus]|uniref:Uncharacterized protein n=1 Tax=Ramazzottius varieornatus TaxID=947166 RepID=A0A1D1WBT4_RAMVA|nr:hypothetical protein RvY_18821 [Ramazzottius varieornatus]
MGRRRRQPRIAITACRARVKQQSLLEGIYAWNPSGLTVHCASTQSRLESIHFLYWDCTNTIAISLTAQYNNSEAVDDIPPSLRFLPLMVDRVGSAVKRSTDPSPLPHRHETRCGNSS